MRSLPGKTPTIAEMPRSRKHKPTRTSQTKDANTNNTSTTNGNKPKSKTTSSSSTSNGKSKSSKSSSNSKLKSPQSSVKSPTESIFQTPRPKNRKTISATGATANQGSSGSGSSSATKPLPVRRIQSSSSSSSILTNTPNSFTPITAHYALNQTLYQAFYKLYEKKHYKTALSVGIQFCRVALWDITQHSYYNSTSQKYVDLKIESARCAVYVSDLLPHVLNKARQIQKLDVGKEKDAARRKEDQDKEEEVIMLKEVAKDHYHYIMEAEKIQTSATAPKSNTSQASLQSLSYANQQQKQQLQLSSSSSSSTSQQQKKGKTPTSTSMMTTTPVKAVKKEVLEVDEDEYPAWLRVLECGNTRMTLCPPSLSPPSASPTTSYLKSQSQSKLQRLETVVEDANGKAKDKSASSSGGGSGDNNKNGKHKSDKKSSSRRDSNGSSGKDGSGHSSSNSSKKIPSSTRAVIDDDEYEEDDGHSTLAVITKKGQRRSQAQKGQLRRKSSVSEEDGGGGGVEQQQQQLQQTKASSPSSSNDRLKNRYGTSNTVEFTRTTSAPAHLGPAKAAQALTASTPAPTPAPSSTTSTRNRTAGSKISTSKHSSGRTSNTDRTSRGKHRKKSRSRSSSRGHGHGHRQRKVQPLRTGTRLQPQQEEREPVEDQNRHISLSESTTSTEEEDVVDLDVYPSHSHSQDGTMDAHGKDTTNTDDDGVIYVETMKSKEEMQYEADLERALYLSGIEIQPSASAQSATGTGGTSAGVQSNYEDARYRHLKPVESDVIGMDTLSALCKSDFDELRKEQMIQVEYLDTYQGRVRESINGCTVIAPLLAIHHLCDEKMLSERNNILSEGKDCSTRTSSSTGTSPSTIEESKHTENEGTEMDIDMFIDNHTIKTVIDIQAPRILPQVRGQLGLHQDALIIPADVHDYLIEQNFLTQDQFAGVYGGNILDDEHIGQFIENLCNFDGKANSNGKNNDHGESSSSSRKVAATFFFHEHVVALHRITPKIDSSVVVPGLENHKSKKSPSRKLFRRMRLRKKKKSKGGHLDAEDSKISDEEMWFEIIDSLPGASMLTYDEDCREEDLSYSLSNTARIRCNSAKSLQACLRWYACSKFTESDRKFINSYQWDDMNMEFDPRVFQAFVWSD